MLTRILHKIFKAKPNSMSSASPIINNTRNVSPEKQDTEVYWNEDMAKILETWGEKHVWNEIQMFLSCAQGKVLDIACGTGTTIRIVSRNKYLDVFGCDISDLLISKAIEKGISPEKLQVCDATLMSCYSDDEFQYSYSIGSLEHFTEQGIIDFVSENHRITKRISFHMVPVSRNGKNNGWIKTLQSYFNNNEEWWIQKFKHKYDEVIPINSGWEDQLSIGKWFVCVRKNN